MINVTESNFNTFTFAVATAQNQPHTGDIPNYVGGGAGGIVVFVLLALINRGTDLLKNRQAASSARDSAESQLLTELVRNQNGMITQLMQHLDASGSAQRRVLEEIEKKQAATGDALVRVSELLTAMNTMLSHAGDEKNAVLERLDAHVLELEKNTQVLDARVREMGGHRVESHHRAGSSPPLIPKFASS